MFIKEPGAKSDNFSTLIKSPFILFLIDSSKLLLLSQIKFELIQKKVNIDAKNILICIKPQLLLNFK